MANTTRAKRPLSPHLSVYRPQITSTLSILHRATGCFMALALALIVWWLLAAATGPEYYDFVDGVLTSWIGGLIMLGAAASFFYHLLNGLRHLWWDIGNGFDLGHVTSSGYAVLGGSAALTLLLLIVM